MSLKLFVFLIFLSICFHESSSSLYPSDRWQFPVISREIIPDNVLSESMVHLIETDSNQQSSSPTDYIQSSELVRFDEYSSILGSPLASLGSLAPPVNVAKLYLSNGTSASLSSPTSANLLGKSVICNEETVEAVFPVVALTRHHSDEKSKELARHRIMGYFWKYGLETCAQRFTTRSGLEGVNLIGVWPSKNRNKTGDSLVLVGGHYDTVKGTQGIDDNGSGIVAILELVRLIGTSKPSLDHSIFFVAFDFEESGLWGSKAFVSDYFIQNELLDKKANFLGAYIIDMILTWDPTEGSQSFTNDFKRETPIAIEKSRKNKYRGDFASIWMRRGYDKVVWEPLEKSWNKIANSTGNSKYKVIPFDADLPDKTSMKKKDIRDTAQTFLRSDHSSFWYHGNRKMRPLNALLITDLGPWRGYQKSCYHKPCDDWSQLTPAQLGFVAHVILTLHDLITVNPPLMAANGTNKRRETLPSSHPATRKWVPATSTSLNWPVSPPPPRRIPSFNGFGGPSYVSNFNPARSPSDVSFTNWLYGASQPRFISIDPFRPQSLPSSTWNGNNIFKSSRSTSRPSISTASTPSPSSSLSTSPPPAESSSPSAPSSSPSSQLPVYDISNFNSRTFTNPWYTFNRRAIY